MSALTDKVVYLAYSNPDAVPGSRSLLSCSSCKNKTFVAVYIGPDEFPMLQCPACGQHIGKFGWAHDK